MIAYPPEPRPSLVVVGELDGRMPPGIESVTDRVMVRSVRTPSALAGVLPDASIVLLWDFSSTLLREYFHLARNLRWVHVAGAGVDAVMTADIAASDVAVTNARGVFNRSIAETVVAMMLVFAKDILTTLALQARRSWLHRDTEMLAGQTALIVGAGEIGRAIGRALGALGVEVTGVATSERHDRDLGRVRSVEELDALLPTADFVVLVLPLTHLTRGMIGTKQLALMKTTARLINVGRGQLVDEGALIAALQSRSIGGAALDVFQTEPLPPQSPLWTMPNVIVSPHMSADFHGWLEALAEQFYDNLDRWLGGRTLLNVVDKKLGYVSGHPAPEA
ncbi:MAG: D-2-hydroxyacid dehydrogenase [bacterium]|nr:D-2-hydroxyacid dehydrogenase [bacterium]